MKIGVVKEGFTLGNSDAVVNKKVLAAADVLRRLGAQVEEISIPVHSLGKTLTYCAVTRYRPINRTGHIHAASGRNAADVRRRVRHWT